ncbi:MAG: HyaD/HybD family hydrogenase maturation endopeptidase [Sulfurospirillaceae bacterium]|nr:HyaD/HybD family hydrogenase maturation endopeptidase [Sulfurospirillaceae bacterium]
MRVLVLGIGNVMFSDEGVGVHLCRLVEQKYAFSSEQHSLHFVDGGTLAQRLIPVIAEYDYLIVLDCVDANDGKIGDVYFFDFDNVPESISWQGSAHEIEMLQTLKMMDMVGDRPPTKIVGIIPEVVNDTTLQMTPSVIKGSEVMEKTLLKHLEELGFSYKKMSDIGIQEVADASCKEDR